MLPEADYGMTEMAMGGQNARYAQDSALLVKFFKHPLLQQGKTKDAGRPIFEEVDHIQIMQPGNKDSIIIRPATEMDKSRFAEHYSRYQVRQDEEYIEGTLLEDWPAMTRSMAEELKFFNIRTVEQLVEMSDVNAQNIMGIGMLQQKARAYLEASANEKAAEDLEEVRAENARLSDALEDMRRRMEELELAAAEVEED